MKTPRNWFKTTLIAASVACLACSSQAAVLYNVQFGNTDVAGINVTTAMDVTGSSGALIDSTHTYTTNANFNLNDGGATSSGLITGGAVTAGTNGGGVINDLQDQADQDSNYFAIVVSAAAGKSLDLTSMTFEIARGTGGTAVRGFEVYAETNGGAFVFGSSTEVADVDSVAENRNSGAPLTSVSDLSGLAEFQGVNSVEFRFYQTASTASGNMDWGNITVNGDVVAVPEPSTVLTSLLGLLAFGARRRR